MEAVPTPNTPSWLPLTPDQQVELESFMPRSGWRVVASSALPSAIPESLRRKIDSALVVASPTSSGGICLLVSNVRVDFRARALDLEPFALFVGSSGADSTGLLVHHGSWRGRTHRPPASFWAEASSSKVGDYYLATPPSGRLEGTLDELPPPHAGALEQVLRTIRSQIEAGSQG